jgi:hypothetical protein
MVRAGAIRGWASAGKRGLQRPGAALGAETLVIVGVDGFALAQNGEDLADDPGADLQDLLMHGGKPARAEESDLTEVAEFVDDLFKSGVHLGDGVVGGGLDRERSGDGLGVETLGWMERVSFIISHIALL